MKLKALVAIVAVTLGSAVALTGTANAAPGGNPFCITTGLVTAGNGWKVEAPQTVSRTGGRYLTCYLEYGDRSDLSVGVLQRNIKYCYGIAVPTTGYYDSATVNAVKRVQKLHGLTVDGVYGVQTFKAMRWRLGTWPHEDDPVYSERCYQPFAKRSFATAPAPGSYSPFCIHDPGRASGGLWTTLPGTVTRAGQVSFACYLEQGDRGWGVRRLQLALRDCYRASLPADGVYGAGTKATVQRVQKLHGITADGIYGPATMKAMYWRFHDTDGHPTQRCYSPF